MWHATTVLMATSFAIATISLLLNISLRMPITNAAIIPFTPFNLPYENTTVNPVPLKNLQDCYNYISKNVPNVTYFNTTIEMMNITNNLTDYTGAIIVLNRGNLTVNTNTPLNYTRQTITIANSSIYYVQIIDPTLFYVQTNGTNSFQFDNWVPPIYQNGTYDGYFGIYDLLRMKIQSAPGASIQLNKLDFNGLDVIMSDQSANLTEGDVVGITRPLQIL